MPSDSLRLSLSPEDNGALLNLCGWNDEHIEMVEKRFDVHIQRLGFEFTIKGSNEAIQSTIEALQMLYRESFEHDLEPKHVHLILQPFQLEPTPTGEEPMPAGDVVAQAGRKKIKGRSPNQQRYIRRVQTHDINFGVGPAGTGKTYIAVACAVESLLRDEVRRIILVRPAVEAGEKLGFLPGDLTQKVDPYLRPLYDALYEMLGFEKVEKLIEKNVIEIAPLAFMRGRTLNESFVILDEAQNTTPEQMKMFLTRIGFGSTAVITGDVTQIDLPKHITSGLRQALDILDGVDGISVSRFDVKDVVRHPLVQKVIEAYERLEN